jgi:hypothetical protein
MQSLRLSAWHFALGHEALGRAFADLSVTGRRAFAAFRDSQILEFARLPLSPLSTAVAPPRPTEES